MRNPQPEIRDSDSTARVTFQWLERRGAFPSAGLGISANAEGDYRQGGFRRFEQETREPEENCRLGIQKPGNQEERVLHGFLASEFIPRRLGNRRSPSALLVHLELRFPDPTRTRYTRTCSTISNP
jgi:hypothetical protein